MISDQQNQCPEKVRLALGRLFQMMMRPEQAGDADMYHAIRAIVLDASDHISPAYRHNWAAQRRMGAQGDL